MARKKRKGESERYLPGATWKDVMAGRAVTRADRERREVRRVAHRCRDCPFRCFLVKRAGTMRCERCGGVLDPNK